MNEKLKEALFTFGLTVLGGFIFTSLSLILFNGNIIGVYAGIILTLGLLGALIVYFCFQTNN